MELVSRLQEAESSLNNLDIEKTRLRENESGLHGQIDEMRILIEPKNSILSQYRELFKSEGIDLCFADDYIKHIAERSVHTKTGARGLRNALEETLNSIQFDMKKHVENGVKKITINGWRRSKSGQRCFGGNQCEGWNGSVHRCGGNDLNDGGLRGGRVPSREIACKHGKQQNET